MKTLKKTISISIDHEIYKIIKFFAEGTDRTLSQYINQVLREHLSVDTVKSRFYIK